MNTCNVIALAYYTAQKEYVKVRELPSGKGFADIVFIPGKYSDKPAMVVELKYDKSVEGAINQIKDKRYVDSLEEYQGDILLVGINYDKNSKNHSVHIVILLKIGIKWGIILPEKSGQPLINY